MSHTPPTDDELSQIKAKAHAGTSCLPTRTLRLVEEIQRLRNALAFYAYEGQWDDEEFIHYRGGHARYALAGGPWDVGQTVEKSKEQRE